MYKELFRKNSRACRIFAFFAMCLLTLLCAAAALRSDIFRDDTTCTIVTTNLFCLVFLTLLSGYYFFKGETGEPMRYFTLFLLNLYIAIFFATLVNSVYGLPNHVRRIALLAAVDCFFSMALFLTLWLYQKQFLGESAVTRAVSVFIPAALVVYTAALILNLFHPILFSVTEEGVYFEGMMDCFSVVIDASCLISLCAATLFSNLNWNRKLSFICCVFSPVLLTVLSLNMDARNRSTYVLSLLITFVLLPVCLIFYNANDELEKEVLRHEKEQIELQVSAMISQMQPHFLYNCLSVIAALCEEDPGLAAKATNAFSDYLRENISFANKSGPISFSEELSHIKVYAWLEKLRFPKKLNIEYDIQCTAFPVPALSVQPIVENAIKHGICKTRDGGTVRISSFETKEAYNVTVSDDGAGFDASKPVCDGRQHLGIENTRYRIREMAGGSLDLESAPGKGTTVTIRIPK